jgi:DNA recombination protein RmuC
MMITYILIAVVATVVFCYFVFKKSGSNDAGSVLRELNAVREEMARANADHRKELQERMDRIDDQLDKKLTHSHESIQKNFDQTSKIISDVTEKLTTLDKTNKQVLDFSSQLQNLQNILKNPKQRGVLGEYWLETLLSNVLPQGSYQMQFPMGEDEKTGKQLIADAIIRIRAQIIPIDAKFSLENYNRMAEEHDAEKRDALENELKKDVKNRIDETAKYIRPEIGTMGFAFMFIPAEGVYYNLLNAEVGSGINSKNLIEYAFSKHVMIVSPTSFYAYLQTVLLGLKELALEQSTTVIIKQVAELGKHFNAYTDYHKRMGANLGVAVNQFNLSSNELRKVGKDVNRISTGAADETVELEIVDKPQLSEGK